MFGLFSKAYQVSVPELHYRALAERARDPVLYREFGVPDTLAGRFDLLVLHLVLLLRRLRAEGEIGEALGQDVFDLFVRDMDRSMRELGVGDLGMKRRMRDMAKGFYARAGVYNPVLDAGDEEALTRALEGSFFSDGSRPTAARALAAWVLKSATTLRETARGELLAGEAAFAGLELGLVRA